MNRNGPLSTVISLTLGLFLTGSTVWAAEASATDGKAAPEPKTETPKPDIASAVPASADTNFDAVANSVVKIFSTVRYPDVYKPWTKDEAMSVTGSGVVIPGKRILSNAHVVKYASQIQIQANQAGDKLTATVEAIAPGIDLAILKLEDETFFDTHPALNFAKAVPEIKDTVMVYGYPEGGTSLSITKGIVSRIEFASYNYPVSGLRIQIDAAINPGNSGGPAIVGDKMIGLAFSHLRNAENIGYIIPTEEIDLFLKDIADGHYDGKPRMFDDFQTLENPSVRAYLHLDKSVQGLVVRRPDSADVTLKPWDVITKIGDTPIDDQGMVKVGPNLRVGFGYLIQSIAKDGKVPLTIVRNSKEMRVDLPVSNKNRLLLRDLGDSYPSFFICGPLVFSTATEQYVRGYFDSTRASRYLSWLGTKGSPLLSRMMDTTAYEGEELVIVPSPFFPHKLSKGYGSPAAEVVKSINHVPIKNLAQLVQLLRDSKDEFITIEFDTRYGETLVFPRAEMLASTEDILTDNGIRSQGSPDMMKIWNEKPTAK